jgi:hypothetical protein
MIIATRTTAPTASIAGFGIDTGAVGTGDDSVVILFDTRADLLDARADLLDARADLREPDRSELFIVGIQVVQIVFSPSRMTSWPRGRVAAWPHGRMAAWPRYDNSAGNLQ